MVETALDRLEKAMADTAVAIRSGNLSIMGALADRTDTALAELGTETDTVRIRALRELARQNATALEAAGRGVRAARRRLAEVTSARSGVQTYDIAGNTQKIGGPSSAIKARF